MKIPKCLDCGKCCTLTWRIPIQPFGDEAVPVYLTTGESFGNQMKKQKSGACIAFDYVTRECKIYNQRPLVCRTFERGSENCKEVLNGVRD